MNFLVRFSGPRSYTIVSGAASDAALNELPAIAVSGASGSSVTYTTLQSDPSGASTRAARIYSDLTVKFVKAFLAAGPAPYLATYTILNINYPSIDQCTDVNAFKWVFSRVNWNLLASDVTTCGSSRLPDESSVVGTAGCYASVSVLNARSKLSGNKDMQQVVYDRMKSFFTCLP